MVFPGAVFDVVEDLTIPFFEKIFFRFRIAPPHPPPKRKMHICRPGRLVLDPWYGRSTLGGGVGDLDWRGLHPAGARCRPGRSSHIAIWHQIGPFGSKRYYCFTKANSKNEWILIGILLYFWKNQGCEVFFGQYCTGVSKKNFNKGSEFIWERPRWPSAQMAIWARWVQMAIWPELENCQNWRILQFWQFSNSGLDLAIFGMAPNRDFGLWSLILPLFLASIWIDLGAKWRFWHHVENH